MPPPPRSNTLILTTKWVVAVGRWCPTSLKKIVGQGPTLLAVGEDLGSLDICFLAYHFFFLSQSLWETARYRLKHCVKEPLRR